MNSLKTWMLMGIMTILLVFIGRFIGGPAGMSVFLVISVVINAVGYWTSGKMAIWMTHSRTATESEIPNVYAIVRQLSQRANLPMPEIYITPSAQPNAFATGRNPANAKVAVTEGILQALSDRELEGVLAHEMAHIKNRDILISSLAATFAGVITYAANMLQFEMWFGGGGLNRDNRDNGGNIVGTIAAVILAPLAATLVQLAITRAREFKADETGAHFVGDGNPLADALERLEWTTRRVPSTFNPATSHMFIVNPLRAASLTQLFQTHPPTEERVRRLRNMRIL